MDELVIGEKKYISSKRAAQLTGYAKDYIGQLCREGRVEARLVGRSWYVLESSVSEHRFGKEAHNTQEDTEEKTEESVSTWDSPKYVAETVSPLPELSIRERSSGSINVLENSGAEPSDIPSNEALINAPQVKEDATSLVREDVESVIPIERVREEVAEIGVAEESIVPIHKIQKAPQPVQRQEQRSSTARSSATRVKVVRRKTNGGFTAPAMIIAAAIVAITIMVIGTGIIDNYSIAGVENSSIFNFLGGKSFYSK